MIEPRPLGFGEVPWHADFGGGDTDTTAQQQQQPTQTHPQVADFVKGILDEAKGADWDIESWRSTGTKKLAKGKKGPYADVRQYAKDVAKDTWFGRVSDHAEAPPMRFVDMDFVLRQEHSYHEGQYTPEVVEVNRVLSWEKELHAEQGKVEGWNDVRMESKSDDMPSFSLPFSSTLIYMAIRILHGWGQLSKCSISSQRLSTNGFLPSSSSPVSAPMCRPTHNSNPPLLTKSSANQSTFNFQ